MVFANFDTKFSWDAVILWVLEMPGCPLTIEQKNNSNLQKKIFWKKNDKNLYISG